MLFTIFSILTVSTSILFFVDSKNLKQLRFLSLTTASIVLILSCLLLNNFDSNIYFFQYFTQIIFGNDLLNLNYSFALDNLAIYFFVLSSLLIFLCILFI